MEIASVRVAKVRRLAAVRAQRRVGTVAKAADDYRLLINKSK